ncbi:hypothetical protein K469DRAFT_774749, partial [Zopfia rhizophila CBS 207.26]
LLLAHAIYVLQPLDFSCFSPVKSKYRNYIDRLACIDDTTPIKKNQFIEYYSMTRKEGLTSSVIKNGWKAAGLVYIIEAYTALQKAKLLTYETNIVLHRVGKSIDKL